MEKKLVITAVAAFSLGAFVSWAITGDYEAMKARRGRDALRDVIGKQNKRFLQLSGALEAEERMQNSTTSAAEVHIVMPLETDLVPKESTEDASADDEVDTYVVPDGETVEETRSNLQALIDQYQADPTNAKSFVDAVAPTLAPGYRAPIVITKAQYAWDDEEPLDYAKITLTYFPRDRVLLDEDEAPMEDVDRVVGWKNLTQFGGVSEDPDTVFIRNHRLEIDYEVVRDEENELPLHVKYGMDKDEYEVNKAAGTIKFRRDDRQ